MAAVALVLSGCGGEEAERPESGSEQATTDEVQEAEEVEPVGNTVVGTWEVVEVIRGEDWSNTGTVYVFGSDGSMSSSSGALTIEGTYTIVGDTLKIVLGGIDMDILFSFDEGRLVYEIINGEQTFLMERQ
jgi:hypothetical protein